MKMKCMIVDDEPLARKGLREYISGVDFLELQAECENATKANNILQSQQIHLAFLDIQMPAVSGIDFLKSLSDPPMVIFTTAYSEFAIDGYALNVIDYLVKPLSYPRFMQAVNKANDYFRLKTGSNTSEADYFFLKVDSRFEKIFVEDVLYIEALQNYSVVYTSQKKMMSYITLSALENQLPADKFIKIHKSYIVAVNKITSIEANIINIYNTQLPISRSLKDEVMNKIVEAKLIRRDA